MVTNELESNVTNSHCQQASGLAVQESCGGMSSMPGVIPSRVRERREKVLVKPQMAASCGPNKMTNPVCSFLFPEMLPKTWEPQTRPQIAGRVGRPASLATIKRNVRTDQQGCVHTISVGQ